MNLPIDDRRVVSIHYQLTNGFGELIDSSSGDLPLVYMHNSGALLSSLERELTGCCQGEQLSVVIYPEDGYGYANEELIQTMPRELFKSMDPLSVGQRVKAVNDSGETEMLTIVKLEDDSIVVDANHPLAGQVLHFEIAVVAVREPTEDELKQGFASATNPT